jgi:hypothetical protein
MLSVLVSVLLTQSSSDGHACVKHSDCIITTTQCCSGCCGPSPYVTSKADEAQMLKRCSVIECAGPQKCDIVCEPPMSPDALEARCVAKQCVARLKKTGKR